MSAVESIEEKINTAIKWLGVQPGLSENAQCCREAKLTLPFNFITGVFKDRKARFALMYIMHL